MKEIWEFYENMNELVYVSDIDSHEIVYMNRMAREIYGFPDLEDLKGKLCYEVLQGLEEPCEICTNKDLQSGYFVEWKHYNPKVQRSYALKDTLIEYEGRRLRVELAIDLTVQERQKKELQNHINSEAVVNEILQKSLAAPTPEASIEKLLSCLNEALKCDRVYIFEKKENGCYANTYEHCAPGVTAEKDNLQDVTPEAAEVWVRHFTQAKNVIIRDLEEIRETDPLMYDVLKPQSINSLVVGPLFFKQKLLGFYGVDNPPGNLVEHISVLFQILGHFMVALLRRRDLFRKLERLSFCDQLTELGNRHAMDEYVQTLNPEKSIGLVYCDVMGLKKINDSQGHQAGDELLLRAAECLRRVFHDKSLFRMGGDEFLVICPDISRQELLDKAEFLKRDSLEHSALMAQGCLWKENSREDIDQLIKEADALMYQDKRRYYGQAGA
jgi:diguanylate cyclase (GGDEF)-like protein